MILAWASPFNNYLQTNIISAVDLWLKKLVQHLWILDK